MKRFAWILIIGALCIGAFIYFYPHVVRMLRVQIDDVTFFEFKYTSGYGKETDIYYKAECNNNICTATVKKIGVPMEKAVIVPVDQNFMRRLKNILRDYHINKWNGFNKTNGHVLDGNSFTLHIKMVNGRKINAYGYMDWPSNYSRARNEFDELFKDLVDD